MLTARIQAIDGTRTFTPLDSQLCRLLRGPVTCSPSLTMALSVGFTSFELACSRGMRDVGFDECLNGSQIRLREAVVPGQAVLVPKHPEKTEETRAG